jgi:hypothetical protein
LAKRPRHTMDPQSTVVLDRVLTILALGAVAIWRIRNNAPLGDWRTLMVIGIGLLGAALFIELWEELTGEELWDALTFNFPTRKGSFGISRRCLGLAYVFLGAGAIEFISKHRLPRVREDE